MKTIRSLAAIAVVIVLSGCMPGQYLSRGDSLIQSGDVELVTITPEAVATSAPVQEMPQDLLSYQPESYRISAGDTLLVTVWEHPELTTPAGSQQQAVTNGRPVQSDGTLFFPYAGKIQAAGMTVEELRAALKDKLARYVVDPQIDVNVVGYGNRVALQGAFTNSAPQNVTTVPLTLSQAIGTAGINLQQADLSGFVLTRDRRNYRLDLDALYRDGKVASDIYLKPGDHLYLPFNDRKEAYVMGEVLRPQALNFKTTEMSLTQALGRTGGLNPITSSGKAVYVIRGMDNLSNAPATVYHLDAKSPSAFVLASRFAVRPGDVVWVGAAGITRWNRFLSQLLPLTGIISNTANAQYNLERNDN